MPVGISILNSVSPEQQSTTQAKLSIQPIANPTQSEPKYAEERKCTTRRVLSPGGRAPQVESRDQQSYSRFSNNTAVKDKSKSSSTDIVVSNDYKARRMVTIVRNALQKSGYYSLLSDLLREKLSVLVPGQKVPQAEDVINLLVDGWIEELLRFLTIKAIVHDTKFPFQMAPSRPIDEAWISLLVMPMAYSLVCRELLGDDNEELIDRDPFTGGDAAGSTDSYVALQDKHLECSRSVYMTHFEVAAPKIYWPDRPKPKQGMLPPWEKMGPVAGAASDFYQKLASVMSNSCQIGISQTK